MDSGSLFYSFFLIFTGAALLATVALATRQPLIVAYIALGGIFGPYGLEFINDTDLLTDIGHAGIIFLLFLLGLDMQPSHLMHMLRKTAIVGLLSSVVFAALGYGTAYAFGFSTTECLVIGGTMMFSSTIIGIKLLPTTVLHHKHTGELLVSLLLLQDLLAIMMLLVLYNSKGLSNGYLSLLATLATLPLLVMGAWGIVRYMLLPLMAKYDRFHEYMFLLAIGWCLGLAELAHTLGLSAEIGAFVAGITIATSPIAQYIAINLKPLRDFFLILFFFSVGASFNLGLLDEVIIPGLVLSAICLLLKPPVFWFFLRKVSEKQSTAWEVGARLGQNSEFSLLIATVATSQLLIDNVAAHVIQAVAILTLLLSSYIVVFRYESPIAVNDRLRRD
ncbi:cation:proton antiporter [Sansalvadorimonas sp. 2012CJ34-2]|uniref:Cation:proton antiporter n=1 Tax=Parendozoicomonas callyspongiae TaxID=2942213 RepID=A0ABT0PEV1_9GAMM|nr:cation:proton antiporter [Sansalvadorimonas sp. 2012CJ34-2]MCL6269845.1 cation:proton antiporter [Sansalvadorimonas sp. 2012CJ34-2]